MINILGSIGDPSPLLLVQWQWPWKYQEILTKGGENLTFKFNVGNDLKISLSWCNFSSNMDIRQTWNTKKQQRKHCLFFQASELSWVDWIEIVRNAPRGLLKAFAYA